MAKILVNYPTRSRPAKFFKIMTEYVDLLSGKHQVTFLIKIDWDDASMNNVYIKQFLEKSGIDFVMDVLPDCKGKIDAINRNVSKHDFDIVICIADDMEVLEQNWDDRIVSDMGPEFALCLNYDSDPRLQDFTSLVVLPIIGRRLYDRFGYVYHPDYVSEYCDNEQTEVFAKLGVLKHVPSKVFNHDWWSNQDALMQRNIGVGTSIDKITFSRRKEQGFV
jgi:hypothetical protein